MTDTILFDRDGPVARITFNRPEAYNALDIPDGKLLLDVVNQCDGDASIRAVVLTGAGKAFCAGGDIKAFKTRAADLDAYLKEVTTYIHASVAKLYRMPKPLVTAVNGSAAGAGVGMALLGDIAIADPGASFMLAFSALGLTPDSATSWMLPRVVGLRRAQEIYLSNRRVDAQEAAAIGMVTRLSEAGKSVEEAMELAHKLSRSATAALGATRKLMLDAGLTSLETHLDAESRTIATLSQTAESREGIAAFLEKRTPDFLGVSSRG